MILADAEAARGQLDQAAALYQAAVEAARDLKEPLFEASLRQLRRDTEPALVDAP